MGEACLDGAGSAKMVPVSLRSAPLEAEVTIPDGRIVRVRVGVPDDSYIPTRELDTVTVELYANGEHIAAVNTVLDADQTLRFPDFRAEERTFSLVTQLAGRTGRGERGGRVLVQTIAPDARSIAFASHHDSDGFLADELGRREALGYPPFSSLIRVLCSAVQEGDARAAATALRRQIAAPGAVVLGPAPLFRLRGRARSQLVIKAGDRAAAIRAVGAAIDELSVRAAKRGVSLSVDVDPQ